MLRVILCHTYEHFIHSQSYLAHMYIALFSTAYFGLFRVGELISGTHPVMVSDVHIGRNKQYVHPANFKNLWCLCLTTIY